MKVRIGRSIKSYSSFDTKKNKNAGRLCMKISSNHSTSVQRCLNLLFQNQYALSTLSSLHRRILNSQFRIKLIVNEYNVDYHPSPSGYIL